MNLTTVIVASGLALCVSIPLVQAQDLRGNRPFNPDPARGYQTASKLCTTCHIIDNGQIGTVQPGVPSFIHMANKPGQTSEKLAAIMIHPFPPMIDTHLTTHEIKDISAYILSLKSKK
ncbi:MAG: cytochrome c [bacterium]|nr:cytochrome c [bacterium]